MIPLGAIVFVSASSTAFVTLLKLCNGEYSNTSVEEYFQENTSKAKKCSNFCK